jgi:hypothetical protein
MNLYQKLFGLQLMAPADDGSDGGGGGASDRGDDFVPKEDEAEDAPVVEADDEPDEDEKVIEELTKPRAADGKFAKREKTDDEVKIPKARFDSAVAKERARAEAAERRLAEIDAAQGQIQRNVDISKAEEEIRALRAQERKAVLLGDDEKASTLSDQADRLNRQIIIALAKDMSAADKSVALEEMRMELTVERIVEQYPELDENSNEFDQDLVDDVNDKQAGLMARQRMSPSKALAEAVKHVMRNRAAAPAAEKGAALGAPVKGRKEAAVAKNLDAARRQPASARLVGADSDKFGQTGKLPAASDMTYDEFSALPEKTKAQMRGDFV